jgi:predicted esterase
VSSHSVKAVLVAVMLFRLQVMLAPLLLFTARSWRGRLEGFFGIIFSLFIIGGLVCLGAYAFGVSPPVIAIGACALGFGLIVVCVPIAMCLNRTCNFGEGAVGSHFLLKEPPTDTTGWSDMEDEYVWLWVQLLTRLDLWMPSAEAEATRVALADLIDAVRTHPDYRRLARGSDYNSRFLICGQLDARHCYSYRPEPREPNERFGLFVFLHGHGSNYLVLLHALRPLADRHRLVLIAPTFGYGNWEAPGSVEAIERATRFGLDAYPIDPNRVFLAGYSQGGAGVSRAGAAFAGTFTGLVFISATMELSVIGSEAFAHGWKGKPVLVIQGERDRNVKPHTVTAAVAQMEADAVRVTTHYDAEGGHFLFLAKRDEVLEVIGKWMRAFGERGA